MRNIILLIANLFNKTKDKLIPGIGFILLSFYIWGRYIRHRLPREIPFDLTILHLIILVIICCGYLYVIYRLIKPKTPPQIILNFLVSVINTVKAFDDYMKQYQIVSKTYIKIFSYLANKINYNNFDFWKKVILIINIVPHLILLCIISLDIFYFHKLLYFYKAIWITLFFFLIPFSLYSFNYVCEHYIIYWEKNSDYVMTNYKPNVLPPELDFQHPDYDDENDDCSFPPGYMEIPIRKFLPIYLDELYYEQKTPHFSYHIIPTREYYEDLFKKYNLTWKTCNNMVEKLTKDDMDLILRLMAIQASYDILNKHTNILSILKNIRIVIYAGYLICWISILVMSLHNFKDFYLLYCIIDMLKIYLLQNKFPIKICIFLLIIIFSYNKDAIENE